MLKYKLETLSCYDTAPPPRLEVVYIFLKINAHSNPRMAAIWRRDSQHNNTQCNDVLPHGHNSGTVYTGLQSLTISNVILIVMISS